MRGYGRPRQTGGSPPSTTSSKRCDGCQHGAMVDITDADVAELIARMDDAADAYIRGDHRHYFSLFDHPDDYTLMPPYGGETRRGFGLTAEQIEEGSRFFESGEARLDVERWYASGDLVVLCAIERQHGVVGAGPTRTGRFG